MSSIGSRVVALAVLGAALSSGSRLASAEDVWGQALTPASFETVAGDDAVQGVGATGHSKDFLGDDCGVKGGKSGGYCCPCQTKWAVRAGVLALYRDNADSAVLFVNPLNTAENVNANDFDLGYEAGLDFSVMRRFGRLPDIEFRYMGSDAWSASGGTVTTAAAPLQINTAIPLFVPTGRDIQAVYASELHSFELNARTDPCGGCVTWLAGFRYIELDEVFHADLIDAVTPAPTVVFDTATRNRLWGGQVGAEIALLEWGNRLRFEFVGKVGVFYNDAAQTTVLNTGVIAVAATGGADRTSVLGEAHLAVNYCLCRNLSLRASYGVMGISDLALATDQMSSVDFFTGGGFSGDRTAFYHGAFLGLQYGY